MDSHRRPVVPHRDAPWCPTDTPPHGTASVRNVEILTKAAALEDVELPRRLVKYRYRATPQLQALRETMSHLRETGGMREMIEAVQAKAETMETTEVCVARAEPSSSAPSVMLPSAAVRKESAFQVHKGMLDAIPMFWPLYLPMQRNIDARGVISSKC